MTDALVVATPATATGFRLGGARTVIAADADETVAAIRAAIEDGTAAIVAVHARLWSLLPSPTRDAWATQDTPLIVSLPDEDGDVSAARDAVLRDLLARAVGYQITFSPGDGTP
jgi:vacuolar-type H+-ATPase subunit F/Vma7